MKDSQRSSMMEIMPSKYIKVNNERFSTWGSGTDGFFKYIKANNERFSTRRRFPVYSD